MTSDISLTTHIKQIECALTSNNILKHVTSGIMQSLSSSMILGIQLTWSKDLVIAISPSIIWMVSKRLVNLQAWLSKSVDYWIMWLHKSVDYSKKWLYKSVGYSIKWLHQSVDYSIKLLYKPVNYSTKWLHRPVDYSNNPCFFLICMKRPLIYAVIFFLCTASWRWILLSVHTTWLSEYFL